mgnify:CR=1 FL=1
MRSIKSLIHLIIFFTVSSFSVYAQITPSAPTNLIQQIASATSFSSTTQSTPASINQIQNTTNTVINTVELRNTVEQDAEAFGLMVNEEALARISGESSGSSNTQLVRIGGIENENAGRFDLEPNLNTIVYDTGLMTLTNEATSGSAISGNYNNDSSNRIFDATTGAQQARIKVFVDFKRKVLWGEVESRIKLQGEASQMINNYVGGSSAITSLPVDKELTHSIDPATDKPLPLVAATGIEYVEPYAWLDKHGITSLLLEDGTQAPYLNETERLDMQFNTSRTANGGANNILVGARFTTPGSGTAGQSTASFEASHAANDASATDFATGVVRYSATATTTAKNFTGNN